MILLPQLAIHFEPAFAFPGERITVVAPSSATVSSTIHFSRSGTRWIGTAPPSPVEVLATMGLPGAFTDATKQVLPIGTNKKYTFGEITVVLLQGGAYGAILKGRRYADLFVFDIAARSSPQRKRVFTTDYFYAGPNQLTLSGVAGGVIRAAATLAPGGIDVYYSTLFEVGGKLRVLDREFDIPQSMAGTVGKIHYSF